MMQRLLNPNNSDVICPLIRSVSGAQHFVREIWQHNLHISSTTAVSIPALFLLQITHGILWCFALHCLACAGSSLNTARILNHFLWPLCGSRPNLIQLTSSKTYFNHHASELAHTVFSNNSAS